MSKALADRAVAQGIYNHWNSDPNRGYVIDGYRERTAEEFVRDGRVMLAAINKCNQELGPNDRRQWIEDIGYLLAVPMDGCALPILAVCLDALEQADE